MTALVTPNVAKVGEGDGETMAAVGGGEKGVEEKRRGNRQKKERDTCRPRYPGADALRDNGRGRDGAWGRLA